MEDAREARRRKLMNRGCDRLAFITGQSRSLPPPDLSPPGPLAASSITEEARAHSIITKGEAIEEISSSNVESNVSKEAVQMSRITPKIETPNEISRHGPGDESKNQATNIPSTLVTRAASIFTSKQISNSVTASENIRIVCSVVIALLVVLFYHVFSLAGKFRPLLLVLLNDLTIIFGRTLLIQEESRSRAQDKDSGTIDMGKILEAAILLKKAMGAISMDCSICAAIIICGIAV